MIILALRFRHLSFFGHCNKDIKKIEAFFEVRMLIDKKHIDDNSPCFFIAEIGSNHDGKLDTAKKMIEISANAGANAVKFQMFRADMLINKKTKDENGHWIEHPAFPILQKLEFPESWLSPLMQCAKDNGILFSGTPFDIEWLRELDKQNVPFIKIASGDLTFVQLLKEAAKTQRPLIVSTGIANIAEVYDAVHTIEEQGNTNFALLHCVSNYPPKVEEINLKAIITLKQAFQKTVGFSDHSPGYALPVASVVLGARIIEKHITSNRNLPGPDHPYALEPHEFSDMVHSVRMTEAALGNGKKVPAQNEIEEIIGARRSLFAKKDIMQGQTITANDIKIVRHAFGLKPKDLEKIIGKKTKRNIHEHDLILLDDFV